MLQHSRAPLRLCAPPVLSGLGFFSLQHWYQLKSHQPWQAPAALGHLSSLIVVCLPDWCPSHWVGCHLPACLGMSVYGMRPSLTCQHLAPVATLSDDAGCTNSEALLEAWWLEAYGNASVARTKVGQASQQPSPRCEGVHGPSSCHPMCAHGLPTCMGHHTQASSCRA